MDDYTGPSLRYNAPIRRIITLAQDQTCLRQVWWSVYEFVRTYFKGLPLK